LGRRIGRYPVQLLMARKGDMTFANLLRHLRCNAAMQSNPRPFISSPGITARCAAGLTRGLLPHG